MRMRFAIVALFVFLALLVCSSRASAQSAGDAFLLDGGRHNAVRLTGEMDPGLSLGIGYSRVVPLGAGPKARRLSLHGDLTALWGFSSGDLSMGSSMRLRQARGFDAMVTALLDLKVAQNEVHTAVSYGYGAGIRPGWFERCWYGALELALRGSFAQTLVHDADYRAAFPGVVDGTYASNTLLYFVGVVGGFRVTDAFSMGTRFAWRIPNGIDASPYYVPYTMEIEASVTF